MSLISQLPNLKRKIKSHIEKSNFHELSDLILNKTPEVAALVDKYVPLKAHVELWARHRMPWSSGVVRTTLQYEQIQVFLERHEDEKKLLTARHPRRIERLWSEQKEPLEKRYGRSFESRDDVAIMRLLHSQRFELHEHVESLMQSRKRVEFFEDLSSEGEVWQEITRLWTDGDYAPDAVSAANHLVGLITDLKNPKKMLMEWETDRETGRNKLVKKSDLMEIYLCPQYFSLGRRPVYDNVLEYYTAALYRDNHEGLDFETAMLLKHNGRAREFGMKSPRGMGMHDELPKKIEEIAMAALRRHYTEKTPQCTQVVEKIKTHLLARWAATADDYDTIYAAPQIAPQDRFFLAFFYSLSKGKDAHYKDDNIASEKLPGAIKQLMQDGYLQEHEIRPPLDSKKRSSLKRMLSGQTLNQEEAEEALRLLPGVEGRRLIAGTGGEELVAPFPSALPMRDIKLEDLAVLGDHLEWNKSYKLLFQGRFSAVIAGVDNYPNGDTFFDKFYTLRELANESQVGSAQEEKKIVNIGSRKYLFDEAKSYKKNREVDEAIWDSNTDVLPVRTFTAIIDISPDDFAKSYFQDFMAQVMMFGSHMNAADFIRDYEAIPKLPVVKFGMHMGIFAHTYFRTFEVAGKFAFNISVDTTMKQDDIVQIGSALTSFLRDAGLSYRYEKVLDEQGRYVAKRKIEDRQFQQENLEAIVSGLQGNGLPSVLTFALTGGKYSLYSFSMSQSPCEECGQHYINGNMYDPKLGEQWFEGVNGKDLHDLAKHPATFTNKFSNLERISVLLSEAKDVKPVFIEYPQILPHFASFASSEEEHLKARGESYQFWDSTMGGIREEEEELEDDPQLRALRDKEIRLHVKETETLRVSNEAVSKLHQFYESLSGKNMTFEHEDGVKNFWAKQLMVFNIYLLNAPKMLPATTEHNGLVKPIHICYG